MAKDLAELKERIHHYSMSLASLPGIKLIGVETAILAQAVKDMRADFFLILILTFVDLITAVIAALKFDKICSWGLRQSALKLSIYLMLVYLGHITQIVTKFDWIESAFMGLIVSTEIVSILENIELINPGMLPRKILSRFGISLKRARKQ